MVGAAGRGAGWDDECLGGGEAERCGGSWAARLREWRLFKGGDGVAGCGGEGAAERRSSIAADEVLFGITGARRGHKQRGESGGDRSEEFGVSRMAGQGIRRDGGSFCDVCGYGSGQEDTQGIRDSGAAGRKEFCRAASVD